MTSWATSSGEVAATFVTSSGELSKTWTVSDGVASQSYIFNDNTVQSTFLTDFGVVPFWEGNLDLWEFLHVPWNGII